MRQSSARAPCWAGAERPPNKSLDAAQLGVERTLRVRANAGAQPLPKAGAQRALEAVGSRPLFGEPLSSSRPSAYRLAIAFWERPSAARLLSWTSSILGEAMGVSPWLR